MEELICCSSYQELSLISWAREWLAEPDHVFLGADHLVVAARPAPPPLPMTGVGSRVEDMYVPMTPTAGACLSADLTSTQPAVLLMSSGAGAGAGALENFVRFLDSATASPDETFARLSADVTH